MQRLGLKARGGQTQTSRAGCSLSSFLSVEPTPLSDAGKFIRALVISHFLLNLVHIAYLDIESSNTGIYGKGCFAYEFHSNHS